MLVGVLRLSPNWLVSKLAGTYVDVFRNVPVLLWILAFMAILTDMTPPPTAFRGDNATAHMLFDAVAITNRGFYIPWPVFAPGWQLVAGIFALSLVAIVAFGRYANARQEATGEILPTFWIKLALIVVPTLLADLLAGGTDQLRLPRAASASTSRAAASSTSR